MYYQIINADEEIVLVKGGGGGWWHTLIIPSDFSVFGFMTAAEHSGLHSALLAPHLD